jgi:predicted nucleic acid-binding protein
MRVEDRKRLDRGACLNPSLCYRADVIRSTLKTCTNHGRAVQAIDALGQVILADTLLTTNNVILETITVARYEGNHRAAVRAGELLYGGTMARLYRTTEEDEAEAFAYLRRHLDKEYSAVDCLSFVVMEARSRQRVELGEHQPAPAAFRPFCDPSQ